MTPYYGAGDGELLLRINDTALPPEERLSDLEDAEARAAERLDGSRYQDDVLRLLFICCHPDLPSTQ